jgi:hypothetical protein
MIYQLTVNTLIPGKIPEYLKLAEQIQPIYPKVGMKIAASFRGYTGDMNSIYVLYTYDDLASYAKAGQARRGNSDYQKIMAGVTPLLISQTTTLLEPNPWSPMK